MALTRPWAKEALGTATTGWSDRPSRSAIVAVASLCALGLVVRLYLLFHLPLNSDEAVVGLMANQIRHGQFFTFYWGQAYGGVEPYLVAILTALWGGGTVAINAVPTVLSAVAAVLTWRLARVLAPEAPAVLALFAGLAVWIWPEDLVENSVQELGFRGVTLVMGLAVLLLAAKVARHPSAARLAGLGLALGIGWWSSPEIVYFALPAALLLFASRTRLREVRWRAVGAALLAVLLGAAPWLETNLRTGFLSLNASSSPRYTTATYADRLTMFFTRALPMALGLRVSPSATWVWGHVGEALYVVCVGGLVAAGTVALARPGHDSPLLRPLGLGIGAFPFIFAIFPAAGSFDPGRYVVYLVPLLVLLLVGVLGTGRRVHPGSESSRRRVRQIGAIGLGATGLVGLAGFTTAFLGRGIDSVLSAWGNPDAPVVASIRHMEAVHIAGGYADYWIAYDLDYLSRGRVVVSNPYFGRWPAENARVARLAHPAWLFMAPAHHRAAEAAFTPGNSGTMASQAEFLATLAHLGVSWRVVPLGLLDAVVPARAVTPREVRLHLVRPGTVATHPAGQPVSGA